MGPLEMVLTKDELCAVVERAFGDKRAFPGVAALLRSGTEHELDAAYKSVGLVLMESGKREQARELVSVWCKHTAPPTGLPVLPTTVIKTRFNLESEDDEDSAPEVPSLARGLGLGLVMGLGKAFGKASVCSTTGDLAAANLGDHGGAVTEWQGRDEMSLMARRMSNSDLIVLELAKAELVAVVKSKLGVKGFKMVEKMQKSDSAETLQLAVGEAQRQLVKASLPRLAAKLAKKWIEFHGRIE